MATLAHHAGVGGAFIRIVCCVYGWLDSVRGSSWTNWAGRYIVLALFWCSILVARRSALSFVRIGRQRDPQRYRRTLAFTQNTHHSLARIIKHSEFKTILTMSDTRQIYQWHSIIGWSLKSKLRREKRNIGVWKRVVLF